MVLSVLAIFSLVVAIAVVAQGRSDLFPIALAAIIYFCVLAIPLVVYREGWGWFHPLIFTVVWWCMAREALPRLGVYSTGMDYHKALSGWPRAELNALVTEALILESLALMVMFAAFIAVRRVRVPEIMFRFPEPRAILAKMLLVSAIALAAFLVLVREAGGIGGLLLQRGVASDEQVTAQLGGHWTFLAGSLRYACLVWLVLHPEVWKKPAFLAFFALSLFLSFGANGSRGGVIVPVLIAISIWSLHHRRIPYVPIFIAAIAVLSSIGILGEFREQTRGADAIGDVQVQSGFVGGVERGAHVIAQRAEEISGVYAILGKVPHGVDHLYGASYLSVPAIPIPSALWKGKPEAGGSLNAKLIFNEPLNAIPPGNVGEAYWNFHIPGVIVVFFLWGALLKLVACFFADNRQNKAAIVFFVLTIFYLQPNSVAVYKWLQALVPALACLVFFCGVRVYRRDAPAASMPSAVSGG